MGGGTPRAAVGTFGAFQGAREAAGLGQAGRMPPHALRRRDRRELSLRRLAASGVPAPPTRRPRGPTVHAPVEMGGDTLALAAAPAPAAVSALSAVSRVVREHLAMQAQDLPGALWSVGVRTGTTRAEVLAAWAARAVTRTWPMRGTLHLVESRDLAWTCALLATRSLPASRARCAQLGLGDDDVARARRLVVAALEPHGPRGLRRSALHDALAAGGIDPAGQRGVVVVARLCMEGLLCQGLPEGAEPTFVLLDAWAPDPWRPGREEAMATVAERYVRSHGPVTERDLAGWTGQTLAFTREAVALASDRLTTQTHAGAPYLVHVDAPEPERAPAVLLLPGFDEYLLGYKDRSAMLTPVEEALVVPGGNGVFLSTVVVGGVVVGTWGRRETPSRVVVTVRPWRTLSGATVRGVERVARDYGRFLDREVEVVVTPGADDGPGG